MRNRDLLILAGVVVAVIATKKRSKVTAEIPGFGTIEPAEQEDKGKLIQLVPPADAK